VEKNGESVLLYRAHMLVSSHDTFGERSVQLEKSVYLGSGRVTGVTGIGSVRDPRISKDVLFELVVP